jgi:hypothetical protein
MQNNKINNKKIINCDYCENKGYIKTYNDKLKIDSIEKCDNCNKISNDKLALVKYLFSNLFK